MGSASLYSQNTGNFTGLYSTDVEEFSVMPIIREIADPCDGSLKAFNPLVKERLFRSR